MAARVAILTRRQRLRSAQSVNRTPGKIFSCSAGVREPKTTPGAPNHETCLQTAKRSKSRAKGVGSNSCSPNYHDNTDASASKRRNSTSFSEKQAQEAENRCRYSPIKPPVSKPLSRGLSPHSLRSDLETKAPVLDDAGHHQVVLQAQEQPREFSKTLNPKPSRVEVWGGSTAGPGATWVRLMHYPYQGTSHSSHIV